MYFAKTDIENLKATLLNGCDIYNTTVTFRKFPKVMELIKNIILEKKDVDLAMNFVRNCSHYTREMEQLIIEKASPATAYFFALDVPDANIQNLESVVIEGDIPKWAYLFAKDIPGANIERLKSVMTGEYLIKFNELTEEQDIFQYLELAEGESFDS